MEFDPQFRVTAFREKSANAAAGWINAGIYLLEPEFLESIPASGAVSLEREVFPRWVAAGRLYGFCGTGRFIDIGTPESYAEAGRFFAAEKKDANS